MAAFQSLTSLSLSHCRLADADLAPLTPLSALRRLDLSGSSGLDAASGAFARLIKGLAQLTSLDLSACTEISNISGLSALRQLQQLDLSYVPSIGLCDLPLMPSLTKLAFKHNDAYLAPAGSTALSKLLELDLNGCYFSTGARGLSALVSLTKLVATSCRDLPSVLLTAIGPLQQLRHLHICSDFKQADPISSFSALATLQHLTHLVFTGPTLPWLASWGYSSSLQG